MIQLHFTYLQDQTKWNFIAAKNNESSNPDESKTTFKIVEKHNKCFCSK